MSEIEAWKNAKELAIELYPATLMTTKTNAERVRAARKQIEEVFLKGHTLGLAEGRKWISCKERMPTIGQEILLGRFLSSGRFWWCGGEVDGSDDGIFVDYELDGEDITPEHWWHPIPTPPQTEADEQRFQNRFGDMDIDEL